MKKKIIKYFTVIILMIIALSIVTSPYYLQFILEEGSSKLESSYYLSQIIMSLFATFGVVVALWQYVIYSRREIEQKDKEIYDIDKARIQKAIDLAEYFKDSILDIYRPINSVFNRTKISTIIDKIPYDKISRFDIQELNIYLKPSDINVLENISKTKDFMDALVQVSMISEKFKDCIKEADVLEEGKTVKKVSINNTSVLIKYNQLLEMTLNNLEFFSMHFIHKTADESVVYQSLHNAFIEIVTKLYYEISINNNGSCEQKYYTNIILLYNLWRGEAIKQQISDAAVANGNLRIGKKLEKC